MRRPLYFTMLLAATLLCGGLLYGAYTVVRHEAIDNLDAQQTILARQATQGIQDFFAHSEKLVSSLAQNPHITVLDPEGERYLETVQQENAGDILAITRVDAAGRILYSTPDNSVAGRDVSEQAHIKKLLDSHRPTVSDVFTSLQGYRTVALHVPVFQGREFRGSLGLLFAFDLISRRYLEGIHVAQSGYAFVLSEQGVILYSPVPGFPGRRIADVAKDFPELADMAQRMLRGESGTATFTFDHVRAQEPQRLLKRAAFLPIRLENTFWTVCVATPEYEIVASLRRFSNYLLPLGTLILLLTALGVTLGLRRFVLEKEIVRRRETEAALRGSEERFHSLFDNMTEAVALYTLVRGAVGSVVDARLEAVNPGFERLLGLKAESVTGRLVSEVYRDGSAVLLDELLALAGIGTPGVFEAYFAPRGRHFSVSVAPWGQDGIASIFSDITERKTLEEQLLFRALHDPLTGLANRTLCLDRIAQAGERALRRQGASFAVVFIDLDRFKVINDSLGHEAGDQLLREVALRLLACTRRVDTVCRYGGDEFALVLEELSPSGVLRTLKRIRESLKTPMSIGSHGIQVEASFGVAYAPVENSRPEDILRNANIALHRAKQHGRNRVVVYKPSMHEAAIQVMSMESDMRRGLDSQEFSLLYQPIFDLNSNQLSGFEALLRWQHPNRGLVGPAEFIPVAEESGFIFELGGFALNRACMDMAELLHTNPAAERLTMSVNLSPRQFSRQGLTEQIDRALAVADLPPKALVLEITESSIMKHPEASAHILARLKERGVAIAIDDFGTGYSSMSALQRLPLDRLKIDMSFVNRITDSAEDREIVRAIITLASSLHLRTVAEGIETEDQRQVLRGLGCDLGQGYLCSRPIPLAELQRLISLNVCAALA